ncbi:MAG: hypothetical protein IT353_22825 [Gemmatimonadaceae bacterium]|nr:hypothetical protein [Gemmatimonadaceae bacterium]
MRILACNAPSGHLEPAPITSLPLGSIVGNSEVSAFWGEDDGYYVKAVKTDNAGEAQWYRWEGESVEESSRDLAERIAIGKMMSSIIPLGGGRVAFPIGSTGRRVYRVWRTGSDAGSRTTIREVRAARSRRQPA